MRVGSQVPERLPMLAQKSYWKFQVSGCRIDEARYADSTLKGSFSNASTYLDIGVSNKLKKKSEHSVLLFFKILAQIWPLKFLERYA